MPKEGIGTQAQQEYIASVILNRVLYSRFPNTVYGVISAPGQFSSFGKANYNSNGYLNATTQAAVKNVLENGDTTGGAIYFMWPSSAASQSFIKNCIFLFNDVTGRQAPTSGDSAWRGTHNFYTTEAAQSELAQHVTTTGAFNGEMYEYFQGDYAFVRYGSGTIKSCGCRSNKLCDGCIKYARS